MNIIFSTLIAIIIILLFTIFAGWIDKFGRKDKEEFIEKTIDKASDFFSTRFDIAMELYKTGPWYLAVYTEDSNYPIWISNNTIRSVHPDPKNRKLIVKQFNGEDMVIENVENYEIRAANKIFDYEM